RGHAVPRSLLSSPTRRSSDLDQARAQDVTSKLSRLNAEISHLEGLRRQLDDAKVLYELAESENDAASLVEVGAEITALAKAISRSEEHTSELQSRENLVCRLL